MVRKPKESNQDLALAGAGGLPGSTWGKKVSETPLGGIIAMERESALQVTLNPQMSGPCASIRVGVSFPLSASPALGGALSGGPRHLQGSQAFAPTRHLS